MDLLTGKARKNNYSFHSVGISLEKIVILKKITVCNSVGDYLKIFLKNVFNKTRK